MNTDYRFGIEEELFLADAVTRGTARRTVKAFHKDIHERLPKAERELLEAQVEISSPPSTSFAEARSVLAGLRNDLAHIGRAHRILVLAAGTHPIAQWSKQRQTKKERYDTLTRDMQMVARRDLVCGMHVHVEVPKPGQRVDLMNRLLPYMPLLLALSASSPFWQGRSTGLAAYRLSVWGEMPRTGLPDLFRSAADYERYVAIMVQSQAIADASFLWWTIRPSIHYPTLELRVADSCTRLEDTLAIAALYRCLVRLVVRRPELNRGLTGASRAIVSENVWRAQRDGIHASFLNEKTGDTELLVAHLDAVLAAIEEDAEALDCNGEIQAAREIASAGTSADHQIACFDRVRVTSAGERGALSAVVDWIAQTTAGPSDQRVDPNPSTSLEKPRSVD
jgi:glutamate---cysteine ligase / carboxylate-amine ligase